MGYNTSSQAECLSHHNSCVLLRKQTKSKQKMTIIIIKKSITSHMRNHGLARCEGVEKTEKTSFFILCRAFIVYAQSTSKKDL